MNKHIPVLSRFLSLSAAILVVLLLGACGANPTATPVPPSPTATFTATSSPTNTPIPTRPTNTPSPTATPSPVVGSVTDNLRVRGGAGTNFPILGTVAKGTSLTMLARSADNKWLQIAYPAGSAQRGWVSSDFIKLTGSPDQLPLAQPTLMPTAASTTPSASAPAPIGIALDLFNRANVLRAENNLPAYKWSGKLAASAQRQSQDMAKTGNIDHTGSDNSTAKQRIADAGYNAKLTGENIYGGTATVDDAWSYWSQDPIHRANLLNTGYTEVGISAVDNSGKTYYTMDLAEPAVVTVPPSPTLAPTATIPVMEPCSPIPGQDYGTLQLMSGPTDRPAQVHPDLNLGMRDFAPTNAPKALVDFPGGTDPTAPQLRGLFANKRVPVITRGYQVYAWDWNASAKGPLTDDPAVTLLGLQTTTGEAIGTPNTGVDIGNGFVAMVLYAAPNRITLKYTREDHVANGYTLHIENICVEPSLLALYQKLNNPNRHYLPALRAGQPLGRANGAEIGVAIRDRGSFMDPRSRKDWWVGQ